MKKKLLFTIIAGGIALLGLSSYGVGPYAGGAGNHTGAAGSPANCSTGGGCHAGNDAALPVTVVVLDGTTPITKYTPGKTYRVLLGTQIRGTFPKFGFQTAVVKASDDATQAGTLATGGRSGIAVRATTPQIIEHSSPIAGISVAGMAIDSVSFLWTAPAAGVGKVRFHAALNAVNFNGGSGGDSANVATIDYDEAASAPNGVAATHSETLAVYPNPASDLLHIRAADARAGIMITDAAGRAVPGIKRSYAGGEWTVDVSALPAGRYHVLLAGNSGTFIGGFLKQ